MRKNVMFGRIKIVCDFCKYKWLTASKMLLVTCPNCQRKTIKKQGKPKKAEVPAGVG